ncbi:MAG: hypothetical protein ACXQTI_05190, partial [Candidatus Nezhaarchaeales archaeon]
MCFSGGSKDFLQKKNPIVGKAVSATIKATKKYDYIRHWKKGKDRKNEKRAATWDKHYADQAAQRARAGEKSG